MQRDVEDDRLVCRPGLQGDGAQEEVGTAAVPRASVAGDGAFQN